MGIKIPRQQGCYSDSTTGKLRAKGSRIHPRSSNQQESGEGQQPGLPTPRAGLLLALQAGSPVGSDLPRLVIPIHKCTCYRPNSRTFSLQVSLLWKG